MENLVPLGTGNSRFMKSNISPNTTLAQLIQMLNNGTFPYDIGPINPAGISQQGTPLNKATLLQDATAALYGLDSEAVPDDVLKKMSAAALAENNPIIDYSVSTSAVQLNDLNALGPGKTFAQKPKVGDDGNYVISGYSFQATGASYSSGEYPDFKATSRATCWAYRAKHNNEYFFVPDADPKTAYYVSNASGVWDGSTDCFFELGTASKDVIGVGTQVDRWSLKTTLGDDIVVGAQIATGSYVGTGTYGASNPNTLTFDFEPKIVIVSRVENLSVLAYFYSILMTGCEVSLCFQLSASNEVAASRLFLDFSENAVSFYNILGASQQLNITGTSYAYTAIG